MGILMKSKNKPIVLITLFMAISLSSIINSEIGRDLITYNNDDMINEDKDIELKSAAYFPLTSAIHIDDTDPNLNWSKTAADNDWVNGSGTWNDPYIIEDVVINGQEKDSGILIENSNVVFFEIRNCTLYNSGDDYLYNDEAGIKLFNTSNGVIINNNVSRNNMYGIYLSESSNNTLSANIANKNGYTGIFFEGTCINNTIVGNEINNNYGDGLLIQSGSSFNNLSQNFMNDNFGNGIFLMGGSNNTISENDINNNNKYGILIMNTIDNDITRNKLTKCGIGIEGDIINVPSNNIDTTNEVNGKSFYLYFNKTGLDYSNFTSAKQPGQILLISVNNSIISSNFNLSQTSVGISLYDCKNITISKIYANDCNLYGIELRNSDNITITYNS